MRVKLVRDNCGAVRDGECRPAESDAEYQLALLLKLHEEAQEIAGSPDDPEEYADLLETLLALADLNGVELSDILEALETKRKTVGIFEAGQIWEDDGEYKLPFPSFTFNISVPTAEDLDKDLKRAASEAYFNSYQQRCF